MKSLTAVIAALIVSVTFSLPTEVAARPQYKKAWDTLYKPRRVKATCTICHPEKGKAKLSAYGKALAEELGETNVKDMQRIIDALKAIEEKFSDSPRPPVPPRRSAGNSRANVRVVPR